MDKQEYIQWLEQFNPCSEVLEWSVKTEYETAQEAWDLCDRSDWMMWLIRKNIMFVRGDRVHRKLILCVCDFLNLIEHLMPEKSKGIIEQLRLWANGDDSINITELRYAVNAAAYTAAAAAAAADTAAAAAAYAAAAAAYAAAYTAAAAAADTARKEMRIKICEVIRNHYPTNPADWSVKQ